MRERKAATAPTPPRLPIRRAIPLLLIYTVLQTKTTELVDSLEMASVKFLNILTEQRHGAAG